MSGFFIRDARYNFTGMAISQLASLLLYGWLAGHLAPPAFGQYNAILGAALLVQGLGGFGIEFSLAADLAAGKLNGYLFRRYKVQMLTLGLVSMIFSACFPGWLALVWLSRGLTLVFNPYRQMLSGSGQFQKFQRVSMVGPMIRLATLLLMVLFEWKIYWLGWGFLVSEMAEGLLARQFAHPLTKSLDQHAQASYKSYAIQSIYQGLTQLCSLLLSRLDWMLMLALLGSGWVALYSYNYKAYELLCLPLAALAPVFFQRLHVHGDVVQVKKQTLRLMSILSAAGMIVMLIFWPLAAPLVSRQHLAAPGLPLSACFALLLPLAYLNHYLWTILFRQNRRRSIFRAFVVVLIFNLVCNAVLMPVWKAEGAALAMVLSLILHNLLYLRQCREEVRMILDHFLHAALLQGLFNKRKRQPQAPPLRISLHELSPLTATEKALAAPAGSDEGMLLAPADLSHTPASGKVGH